MSVEDAANARDQRLLQLTNEHAQKRRTLVTLEELIPWETLDAEIMTNGDDKSSNGESRSIFKEA